MFYRETDKNLTELEKFARAEWLEEMEAKRARGAHKRYRATDTT